MYFLFEHPANASSWSNRLVQGLLELPEVHRVVGNMCMFDMMQQGGSGTAMVKKATGFITNSACIAERLRIKCNGMRGHITLIGGRAKAAEVYPDKLQADCKGVSRADGGG